MKTCPSLFVFAIGVLCLAGCSSVYHTTMQEYTLPKDELLIQRLTHAQHSMNESHEKLASVAELSRELNTVEADKRPQLLHTVDVRLNDAELTAWNTHRNLLAVLDRLDQTNEESVLPDSRRQAMNNAVNNMLNAHSELDAMLDALRTQVDSLGTGIENNRLSNFRKAIDSLQVRIQEAAHHSGRLSDDVDSILGELNNYEVATLEGIE